MSKFDEHENVITVPRYNDVFIYFLIKSGEVVYVGQTKQGLTRPLSHRDKDFDEIKIMYCAENALDSLEDKYIQKYKPYYNKQSNYAMRWGLQRVRNEIRKATGIENYNVTRLNKLLKELDIKPEIDDFNGRHTISFDDYKTVMKHFANGKDNI